MYIMLQGVLLKAFSNELLCNSLQSKCMTVWSRHYVLSFLIVISLQS